MNSLCKRETPPFSVVIDSLDITPLQKNTLKERYILLIESTRKRARTISLTFHVGHTVVTVGSLIVPALLSIQYTGGQGSTLSMEIYWITWVISLLVTISNGLLTLFKIDKKYLYLHTDLEHLVSQGWQYAQLSGRYSGFYTPGCSPSHANQFIYFCNAIEKIRMREIDDEYHPPDTAQQQITLQAAKKSDPFIPPTPLQSKELTIILDNENRDAAAAAT
jgi:hypothetical protein